MCLLEKLLHKHSCTQYIYDTAHMEMPLIISQDRNKYYKRTVFLSLLCKQRRLIKYTVYWGTQKEVRELFCNIINLASEQGCSKFNCLKTFGN